MRLFTDKIEVERSRYEELLIKEERLRLLEQAISQKQDFANIENIKLMFDLNK